MKKLLALMLVAIFFGSVSSDACTNYLVSKGASTDGSVMITYSADAGGFMEPFYYLPAQKHAPNSYVDIYEWDTGKLLGKIKQVPETYRVVGNMNEWQVSIGETTFGGREELMDTNALIDYGSLIYLGLQRAKTAREAIKVMTDLVAEYGYYSSGESFSVADANEAWIMEMISKGSGEKGAVWVARRVPEGMICAHANQARIREFPLNDPENCLYAKDVIEFAKKRGYYDPKKGEFSFVDAYCPLEPSGALACEGRVWSFFNHAAPSLNLSSDYWRAVKGATPYPLFIKPDKKLSAHDLMTFMRDHFEGTDFDMTKEVASEPFGNPYRWKPLGFKIEGDTVNSYYWGRPVSTQQTAFSFISQMRSDYPREIGGLFWYGVDDTYSTVYIPLYSSILKAPKCFEGGSISQFDIQKGFWVFNLVANLAYTKYSYVIKDIQPVQERLEKKFLALQPAIEKTAMDLYKTNPELAVEFLNDYSQSQTQNVYNEWLDLWKMLVAKYNDGYINDFTAPNNANGRHPKGVGYDNNFLRRAVKEHPGYYDLKWREKKEVKKKK